MSEPKATHMLEIQRLGHHGDGVARDGDGQGVFAARTLPGERVSGVLEGNRLGDIRILTPSAHRISPPCAHFKRCGGCALQHASDDFVADWKQQAVGQALAAFQLSAPLRPLHTSPPRSRRRAVLAVRRGKKSVQIGFHERASDQIVPVPGCLLLHPSLTDAFDLFGKIAMLGASRKGALSLMATVSLNGLDLVITGGKALDAAQRATLANLCAPPQVARVLWDGELIALHAPPTQQFGRAHVAPPPGSFLQATREGEGALVRAVCEIVGQAGPGMVADLFAGAGTLSLPLAEHRRVLAVEGERAMLEALDQGWRGAQGLKQVRCEPRDLFRDPLTATELRALPAVVLDPPRAGAQAQCAALAASQVPVIAYVSCNPTTFARDAAQLVAGGYRLEWVQVVDQFRWSAHVELVAAFHKDHMEQNKPTASGHV